MKKILTYFLILSCFVFAGCKKNEIPAAKRIDEKWALQKIEYQYFNSSGELMFSQTDIERSNSYILLYADLNFDLYFERELTNGTYSLGNNMINLTYPKPSNSGSAKDTTVSYTISKKSSAEFAFFNEKVVPEGKEKATLYFLREY
ncbi:MAG: hypothetical protein ABI390_04435 [Daejeonella sp.]